MKLSNHVYVARSNIHGRGAFARQSFAEGSFIGTYRGFNTGQDGTYVLWMQEGDLPPRGRNGTNLLRFLNHSDEPNTWFDGYDLYALQTISEGEELTFDYGSGFEE